MELPKTKLEQLELEHEATLTTVLIHLKSRKSMRYDISKATAPLCQPSAKGQNVLNCCSRRRQKTCMHPSFRCFSPYLART